MKNQTPDRVTYSETRNIAFGDYENRTIFISLGCDLKPKGVDIRESESEPVYESVDSAINKAAEKVMFALDKREVAVRKLVLDNGYSLTGDEESFEKKLLNAQERVKAHKVKKELQKAKG